MGSDDTQCGGLESGGNERIVTSFHMKWIGIFNSVTTEPQSKHTRTHTGGRQDRNSNKNVRMRKEKRYNCEGRWKEFYERKKGRGGQTPFVIFRGRRSSAIEGGIHGCPKRRSSRSSWIDCKPIRSFLVRAPAANDDDACLQILSLSLFTLSLSLCLFHSLNPCGCSKS